MIAQLQRSASWAGRLAVLVVAVLAFELHAWGAPERALAQPGIGLVLGAVMGTLMVVVVVARLLGRKVGLIRTDRQAIVAILTMSAVKIAIARLLLP